MYLAADSAPFSSTTAVPRIFAGPSSSQSRIVLAILRMPVLPY